MAEQLRLLLVALQHYSRIPVTGRADRWTGWDPSRLGRATRYLPLVGLVVALGQGLAYVMASAVLPHPVSLLLAIVAGVLLTGAFHEHGWARFCDAFGAHADRARTVAILREPGLGTYGALGLALLLLLRFEVLAHVDTDWVVVSFACAATFSRGCAVLVMASLPTIRDDADDTHAAGTPAVAPADVGIAIAIAIAPSMVLAEWIGDHAPGLLGVSFALLATAAMRRIVRQRIGGHTGACLGAVQQVAEVAFLLGMLAVLGAVIDVPVVDGDDPPDAPEDEVEPR